MSTETRAADEPADQWTHFKLEEFRCKCGCGRAPMSAAFIHKLDGLRARSGVPMRVSSGYRCPDHNAKVSRTGRTGPHTTGHAADIAVSRGDAYTLLLMALQDGFTGIGLNQKGEGRFLHLDDLPAGGSALRPTVWTY